MKYDDTRWRTVRSITTETPGTFSADADWAGTFAAPSRELLSSAPLITPGGTSRGPVSQIQVVYAWFADGEPVARGSAVVDLDLIMVWRPQSTLEHTHKIVVEQRIASGAAANTFYAADMRGECEYTVRISNLTDAPATATELRVYVALA